MQSLLERPCEIKVDSPELSDSQTNRETTNYNLVQCVNQCAAVTLFVY